MITGQTHPEFPETWTAEVDAAARAHAQEAFPNEAVGIVEAGAYVRLVNVSDNPADEVALSDEDLLRVAGAQVFFHSHPTTGGTPSAHDMEYQMQLGIPFVILSMPENDMFCWGDTLPRLPLIGRGFRHGVNDCFALLRDWFMAERGINIMNGAREWEWWSKGQNLYMDNFIAAGFQEIDSSAVPQVGDCYLFNFNYKVPMHAAIVTDEHLLLHHPCGHRPVDKSRLSTKVPRVRYLHLITHRMRHRDVA